MIVCRDDECMQRRRERSRKQSLDTFPPSVQLSFFVISGFADGQSFESMTLSEIPACIVVARTLHSLNLR